MSSQHGGELVSLFLDLDCPRTDRTALKLTVYHEHLRVFPTAHFPGKMKTSPWWPSQSDMAGTDGHSTTLMQSNL